MALALHAAQTAAPPQLAVDAAQVRALRPSSKRWLMVPTALRPARAFSQAAR